MNRVWTEIDLNALRSNVELSARTVGSGIGITAVVKADAYGHGAVEISKELAKFPPVVMLGVSSVEEGLEIRESGVSAPVLVMGVAPDCLVTDAVKAGLTLSVFTENCLDSLSKAAKKSGKKVEYHLKIDTGMARLGAAKEDVFDLMEKARGLPGLNLAGVFTHFAHSSASAPEPTFEQIAEFNLVVSEIENSGARPRFKHMANSAAIQRFSESFGNMVRPGIMLYGSSFEKTGLTPVMSAKTSVVRVRKIGAGKPIGYGGTFTTKKSSLLATIPVGYKDGYCRSLSNRARVSVNGVSVPVVGEVCMDFTTLDVTGVPQVKIGDEVILFGGGGISVEDVAQWADTIPYEIMTLIGGKVHRRIFNDSAEPHQEN
ncbi:alanine racemase [Candidatus Mycalebacterium sp.]